MAKHLALTLNSLNLIQGQGIQGKRGALSPRLKILAHSPKNIQRIRLKLQKILARKRKVLYKRNCRRRKLIRTEKELIKLK